MKKLKKILILVPASSARGGISNYYQVLKKEFPEYVEYFVRGSRNWPVRKGFFIELRRALRDYYYFSERLSENDISLIQTSTSLGLATTIRDGLFVRLARRYNVKTVVFFRGWDVSSERSVNRYLPLFKFFFFQANRFITLSENAKRKLIEWGYKGEISVETTLVDKELLQGVNKKFIADKYRRERSQGVFNLLFVSRIEYRKGIFELLEAFRIISQCSDESQKFSLNICGDGSELDKVKIDIESTGLKGVEVQGFIEGQQKRKAFEMADLFVFPSHGEGMPNAVLEAMGFGLPVLSTPVGGIVDFFVPGKNGLFIEKENPEDIANKIIMLYSDFELLSQIGLNNYNLGKDYFRSDRVGERIQAIFDEILITKQ